MGTTEYLLKTIFFPINIFQLSIPFAFHVYFIVPAKIKNIASIQLMTEDCKMFSCHAIET